MSKLYFRIDDIAPNMDWGKFNRLISVFKQYNIRPLLLVIPDNRDPELLKYFFSPHFWQIINQLRHDGWVVAQHGFQHLYKNDDGGILRINQKGEFAGLDYKTQKMMIKEGRDIIETNLERPEIFGAPGHSFDKNTVLALKENGFKYLSDGIALYPFKKWGIVWLPQIMWRPRIIPFGLATVALHPNTISFEDLNNLEKFIKENRKRIGNFEELINWHKEANAMMKAISFAANQILKIAWRAAFTFKSRSFYQDKDLKYTDASAYDRRGESSVIEHYVLGLWQPFLKNKIHKLSAGKIIADLGCGTCEYTRSAAAAQKIYAVDISVDMLKICREKMSALPQAEIINASVIEADLPVADLVIAIGVWEYISPRDLYEKIKKISRQGSKVVVVFPNIYNDLNWIRSIIKMKKVALRPGFIKNLFKQDFTLVDSASFGNVSFAPKQMQFLALPIWKFCDWLWRPFQKFLPLGVNIYYLFERK